MKKIKVVFFDFDGVLCTDIFYSTLQIHHPQVLEHINKTIFRGEQDYANRWMRGEFTYHDINKIIAQSTGMNIKTLNKYFIESVKKMKINKRLLNIAKVFKQNGIPVALVTNNMDIFNEITIPHKGLDTIFPVIVNSFDYGVMKHEQNGKLFDIALARLGMTSFQNVLLIDDSQKACEMFRLKGGSAHLFSGIEELLIEIAL